MNVHQSNPPRFCEPCLRRGNYVEVTGDAVQPGIVAFWAACPECGWGLTHGLAEKQGWGQGPDVVVTRANGYRSGLKAAIAEIDKFIDGSEACGLDALQALREVRSRIAAIPS